MSGACPELGFDVRLRLHEWVTAAAGDALLDAMLDEVVEERGLVAEVRARAARLVTITTITRDAGQATEADREAMAAWAAARREVARCDVGPLVDLSGTA